MTSATAGTRLAAVANQRRQQRKQQKNAANETETNITQSGKGVSAVNSQQQQQQKIGLAQAPTASTYDDSTVSSYGSFFSVSTDTDRQSKENRGRYQQKLGLGLTCTTTESTACDDSTISSVGDWSSIKKNQGQFVSPPMTILSPSKKNLTSNNIPSSSNARRLRNSKLRGGTRSSSDSSSVAPSTMKPNSKVGNTSSNSSKISSTTPQNHTMHLCKTPKYNNLSNSKQAKLNSDSSMVSFAVTTTTATQTQDQIRRLTLERESLQSDVALYKRKLQNALESNTKNVNARDALILELEEKIESLAAELKQKEGDANLVTLQVREMERLVAVDDERKRSLHRKELKAVQKELENAEEELARAKKSNKELMNEKDSLESKGNELCKVLQQVEEERSSMKSRVAKYSEQLSKVQMECEVSSSRLNDDR